MSNNAALTCADVAGIGGVEAIATVSGGAASASDIFNCEDGSGVTAGYAAASYTVHVDAINMANPPQSIGDAADLLNKVIQAPNKVTDLGTITIPIAAL